MMAQFVLGMSICPNVVRFLLGGWDKEDEELSLDSMSGIAWNYTSLVSPINA